MQVEQKELTTELFPDSSRYLKYFKNILEMRLVTHRPIVLSHMVTSLCDCKCKLCTLWELGNRDEMTDDQIFHMLDMAKDEGMIGYNVWGGEPLLRKSLPRILKRAKMNRLHTSVITNGNNLPQRIHEIASYIDTLIVSVDHPDAESHEESRGRKGIYERAMKGIDMARGYKHLDLIMNSVISKDNLHKLKNLTELAKQKNVKITFEIMETIEGYNEQYAPSREEISRSCSTLLHLKKQGYPIVNSEPYLRTLMEHATYVCHKPKALVIVDWVGNVVGCKRVELGKYEVNNSFGNVTVNTFYDIFRSKKYQDFIKASEKCKGCYCSAVIEISHFYSLNLSSILNFSTNLV